MREVDETGGGDGEIKMAGWEKNAKRSFFIFFSHRFETDRH